MPTAHSGVSEGGHRELRFEAVGVTDVGRQRKHNEDHVLLRPELDLFVVADGMGGHNAGDIASRLATTSIRNFYEATVDSPVPNDVLNNDYDALSAHGKRLAAGIQKANRDVFEISSTHRQHHGMGSTMVAAYLERDGGLMHVGHVGDSRCYRMRGRKLELLTHDHSLINDALALKPDLTQEELARLPKNIITRALGMREDVKVDVRSEAVRDGDIFLLCSDGLSGMITEADIATVLSDSGDLREACELLVTLANDNGGTDNITAVLVRINDADGAATDATTSSSASAAATKVTGSATRTTPASDANVFVGVGETAKLSDIIPDALRGPLEAGDEVSLSGSFADTFVDSAPLGGRVERKADTGPTLEIGGMVDGGPSIDGDLDAAGESGRCPKCSAELEVGNLFCVECGARIDE